MSATPSTPRILMARGRGLAASLMAGALMACSSGQTTLITREPSTASSTAESPERLVGTQPTGTGIPTAPTGPAAMVRVTSIQPDLVCAMPEEDYDILNTVKTRMSVEAEQRLKRLLSTDFKSSSLSPQDKAVLKFIAREALWIPPFVESMLGDALFNASQAQLTPMAEELKEEKAFAVQTLSRVVSASPNTPFRIELMVLEQGTPSGLMGGRIFIDQTTVSLAMQARPGQPRRDKLAFIYAHELAHIYKRHKAKRLQEQLVSMDEAQKLVRLLLTTRPAAGSTNPFADVQTYLQAMLNMKAIVDGLRAHQAHFLQSQEVEADACAAALMMQGGLGDPLTGFKTYATERGTSSKGWTLYDDHPADKTRQDIIAYVVDSGRAKKARPLEDVRNNLHRFVKDAAKRDG